MFNNGNFFTIVNDMIQTAMDTIHDASHPDHLLYATDDGWVLQIDLPGVDKSEVTITTEDDALLISAANESSMRRFMLGKDVDANGISAKFEAGVLEVSLPRTNNTREISID